MKKSFLGILIVTLLIGFTNGCIPNSNVQTSNNDDNNNNNCCECLDCLGCDVCCDCDDPYLKK